MDEGRMTFAEHLEELRGRILRALGAIVLGMIVVWNYREQFLAWLLRPMQLAWFCQWRGRCTVQGVFDWMLHPGAFKTALDTARAHPPVHTDFPASPSLHFADPTAAFVAFLKLSAIGGFVLALPMVFYQLWSFIAPGLYPREKKLILPFVISSTVFFVSGSLFGYYFVFPVGYKWFLEFSGTVAGTNVQIVPTIMMDEYLSFTSQMLLAFGVVFELPLFVFFLALAGLVTGPQLLNFGRYFTVIAFVLAAVLTPSTDIYSQIMLALPLVGLYFVAVVFAYLFGPKRSRRWRSAGFDEPAPASALTKPPTAPEPRYDNRVEKARTERAREDREKFEKARADKLRAFDEEQRRAAKLKAQGKKPEG
jgi:sec-independent protein translocase protein TatC